MPRAIPRAYRIRPKAKPPRQPTGGLGDVAVGSGGGGGTPPTSGQTIVWNATTEQWEAGTVSSVQPPRRFYWFREDFVTLNDSLTQTATGTGAGTTLHGSGANSTFGAVRSTTGTTATGAASMGAPGSMRLGNAGGGALFDWTLSFRQNIVTLSTSGERYQLLMGFLDNWTGVDQSNGLYMLYDEGGVSTGSAASANWQCVSAAGGTRTFTTSGIAVGTGFLGSVITCNTTATSATFTRLGGTFSNLLATHTTNIPENSAVGFGWLLIKSNGTTARNVDFDFVDIYGISSGSITWS